MEKSEEWWRADLQNENAWTDLGLERRNAKPRWRGQSESAGHPRGDGVRSRRGNHDLARITADHKQTNKQTNKGRENKQPQQWSIGNSRLPRRSNFHANTIPTRKREHTWVLTYYKMRSTAVTMPSLSGTVHELLTWSSSLPQPPLERNCRSQTFLLPLPPPGSVREGTFFIGGGTGLFGCIVFSKVLTLPPGPAKEKRDPSQKIT